MGGNEDISGMPCDGCMAYDPAYIYAKSVDSIKCMGYNKKHKGRNDNGGRK